MIDTETVFILGAGASKPYGYPTGYELKEFICEKLLKLISSHKDSFDDMDQREHLNRKLRFRGGVFHKSHEIL
jgi:hypothetical protein